MKEAPIGEKKKKKKKKKLNKDYNQITLTQNALLTH